MQRRKDGKEERLSFFVRCRKAYVLNIFVYANRMFLGKKSKIFFLTSHFVQLTFGSLPIPLNVNNSDQKIV